MECGGNLLIKSFESQVGRQFFHSNDPCTDSWGTPDYLWGEPPSQASCYSHSASYHCQFSIQFVTLSVIAWALTLTNIFPDRTLSNVFWKCRYPFHQKLLNRTPTYLLNTNFTLVNPSWLPLTSLFYLNGSQLIPNWYLSDLPNKWRATDRSELSYSSLDPF